MSSQSATLQLNIPVAQTSAYITAALAQVKKWQITSNKPGEIKVIDPMTLQSYGERITITYTEQSPTTTAVTLKSENARAWTVDVMGVNKQNLDLLTALLTTGQIPPALASIANTPAPTQKQKIRNFIIFTVILLAMVFFSVIILLTSGSNH